MDDDSLQTRWVAIVYDGGEKVGSHVFSGSVEDDVRLEAKQWIDSIYGKSRDWSLHQICEK